MPEQMTTHRNVHGRKPGRGFRPYLLLPKVLCVGIYLGSVVTTLLVGFFTARPITAQGWHDHARLLEQLFEYLVIPATAATLFFGVLLWLSIFRAMLAMRWFKLKLTLIILAIPLGHLFMNNRMHAFQEAVVVNKDYLAADEMLSQLQVGTIATLVLVVVLIWLGRIKPRLGQNYARKK